MKSLHQNNLIKVPFDISWLLEKDILRISKILTSRGANLYVVGGSVRASYWKEEFDNIDFAINITPYEVKELLKNKKFNIEKILLTGGGRKNKLLKEILVNKLNKKIELIDKYKINGDLVEAQMFAYIGMRSFKNLEISNKNTTGVKKNLSGGILYFPD